MKNMKKSPFSGNVILSMGFSSPPPPLVGLVLKNKAGQIRVMANGHWLKFVSSKTLYATAVPDYESEKFSFEHWRATCQEATKKVYFTVLVQLYINEIWTLSMRCPIQTKGLFNVYIDGS